MENGLLEDPFPFSLDMPKFIFKWSTNSPEMFGNKISFKLNELNSSFGSEANQLVEAPQ